MQDLSIVLVGVGGYGHMFADSWLSKGAENHVVMAGAVEPHIAGAERAEALKAAGVPFFASLEEFYAKNRADLAIISSPIQFHAPQTELAFANGSAVLCEKPMCASLAEAQAMIGARDASGKMGAVGFQWAFSPVMRQVKQDILNGRFGKPKRLAALTLWPRNASYYQRGIGWAGKIRDAMGRPVYDSVANNACAHYLFNMLFLLGGSMEDAALPQTVEAALLRANAIENYDTVFARAELADGAELLFLASHAVAKQKNPRFKYEFEKGELVFDADKECEIIAKFADGSIKNYGDPNAYAHESKLWIMTDALRLGNWSPCSFEAAQKHVQLILAIQKSMPIAEAPKELARNKDNVAYVHGLESLMEQCFEEMRMPLAKEAAWAAARKTVAL